MVAIKRHPRGPRLYVLKRRIHHFWLGSAVCGAGLLTHHRKVAMVGALYAATDIRDFPWRDCDNH